MGMTLGAVGMLLLVGIGLAVSSTFEDFLDEQLETAEDLVSDESTQDFAKESEIVPLDQYLAQRGEAV